MHIIRLNQMTYPWHLASINILIDTTFVHIGWLSAQSFDTWSQSSFFDWHRQHQPQSYLGWHHLISISRVEQHCLDLLDLDLTIPKYWNWNILSNFMSNTLGDYLSPEVRALTDRIDTSTPPPTAASDLTRRRLVEELGDKGRRDTRTCPKEEMRHIGVVWPRRIWLPKI